MTTAPPSALRASTADEPEPDLTSLVVIHRAIRQDLRRIAACLGQIAASGAPRSRSHAIWRYAVTKLDMTIAMEQAAPFSQVCDVWAPEYRSQTLPSVLKGLAGDEAVMRSTLTVAYDSVLPAWQWFLAHSDGKPIILVGDSQGSAVLIHLISAQLEHQPSVLCRLLVAIIVGGNLQVPAGKTVGATFTKVLLCTARRSLEGKRLTLQGRQDLIRRGVGHSLHLYTATPRQRSAAANPGASWRPRATAPRAHARL